MQIKNSGHGGGRRMFVRHHFSQKHTWIQQVTGCYSPVFLYEIEKTRPVNGLYYKNYIHPVFPVIMFQQAAGQLQYNPDMRGPASLSSSSSDLIWPWCSSHIDISIHTHTHSGAHCGHTRLCAFKHINTLSTQSHALLHPNERGEELPTGAKGDT